MSCHCAVQKSRGLRKAIQRKRRRTTWTSSQRKTSNWRKGFSYPSNSTLRWVSPCCYVAWMLRARMLDKRLRGVGKSHRTFGSELTWAGLFQVRNFICAGMEPLERNSFWKLMGLCTRSCLCLSQVHWTFFQPLITKTCKMPVICY